MWSAATLALDFLVQADDGAVQGMALHTRLAVWWKFPRVEQLPQTVPVDLFLSLSLSLPLDRLCAGTYGLTSVLIVFWMVVVALSVERRITLHRRALWLEYFTVGWNVVEALVAIGAGVIAGSVALIGFGADSAIEVISAVGLLWRLRKAGPHATVSEASAAEKRALYVVAITFFLLAIYITWEAVKSLISREEPLTSPVGIILAVLSLAVMPTLAFAKQRIGKEMGSRALVADSKETWVCSYLSLTLLLGVGAYAVVGWWWADPVGALAMLPIILWQGWEALAEAREPAGRED
jgi:predicted Co/Zn/Cd cation transporter (cation efflux family)